MKNLKILFCTMLFFIATLSFGQQAEVPKISLKYAIMAKTFKDSIVLRWAPESPNALPAHIDAGVWVEKLVVSGKFPYKLGKWQRITPTPILPQPLEAFNTEACKKDEYTMLGAQLLYGKLPSIPTHTGFKGVKDQTEMLTNLFSLAMLGCDYSPKAAQMMGMRQVVKVSIAENEKIFFRIYSAFDNPMFQIDTGMTFTTYGEWGAQTAPKFLTAKSQEKMVELVWPCNRTLNRWSGFNIERSGDGKNFTRLNKKPFIIMSPELDINMYYRDSVSNYVKYYYRIQALDPFGDVTDYSESVSCYGSDKTPPGRLVLEENHGDGSGITLKWRFENNQPAADLDHFVVKTGPGVDYIHDTLKILPKSAASFEYPVRAKVKSTYFEVAAVDTAGNYSSSNPVRYFIPDTEPPKAPVGFKATIDTAGIVRLSWQLDTTDEIQGYRVFRKNDPKHEFTCMQQGFLKETVFTDTLALNTLTKDIYYAVAAIDMSYNMSKMTETIKLIKPDKVKPVPPQITHYKLRDRSVTLQWTQSPSDDVDYYQLYRTDEKGSTVLVAKNLRADQLEYTDSALTAKARYTYYLNSTDKSGLTSENSFPLDILAYTNNPGKIIALRWLSEKEKFGFKWTDPNPKAAFYIIYKDTGSGLQQYKSIDSDQSKFTEETNKQTKVRFGLQAVYQNQQKSDIYSLEWYKPEH